MDDSLEEYFVASAGEIRGFEENSFRIEIVILEKWTWSFIFWM